MSPRYRFDRPAFPSLAFGLLCVLLAVLFLAGGASRADALGQMVVRGAASALLVFAILFAEPPQEHLPKPVLYMLLAAIVLVLLQLVPLPPTLWQSLPEREIFVQAATGIQPWRPLSIQPGATINAAASLLVPMAVLVLAAGLQRIEQERLVAMLLFLIGASALVGLMQFAGILLQGPFVEVSPGAVSGLFANRNHFALMMALGCLLAPVWALHDLKRASWRLPAALGLTILFLLLILASGSRAGIVTGMLGTFLGLVLARLGVIRALKGVPRWAKLLIGFIAIATIAVFVLISIVTDRAQSFDRILSVDAASDLRVRAFPTIMAATIAYLPLGSGFGSFDALFRMREPFELLQPLYFNHAHDDFLEILLDGGLPALALLIVGLGWWVLGSIRLWRRPITSQVMLGRLGSAMLLLIFVASVFDYPARTPMMMAMIVLAGCWMHWGSRAKA